MAECSRGSVIARPTSGFFEPVRFNLTKPFGWTFCPGDKVMQVENDYDREVYNGDLGVVSRIDIEEGELHADLLGRRAPKWSSAPTTRLCAASPPRSLGGVTFIGERRHTQERTETAKTLGKPPPARARVIGERYSRLGSIVHVNGIELFQDVGRLLGLGIIVDEHRERSPALPQWYRERPH